MSDAKGAPGDPSMEDILASIRRIIADDETRATVSGRPTVAPPAPSRGREDVLLLTDIVEEPGESVPNSSDPVPRSADGLVEAAVGRAASSAFARLTQVAGEPVPAPIARNDDSAVGGSGRTLEDLVKEMIRPMLKEWLDRNLPAMVEREVEREITRLTRR